MNIIQLSVVPKNNDLRLKVVGALENFLDISKPEALRDEAAKVLTQYFNALNQKLRQFEDDCRLATTSGWGQFPVNKDSSTSVVYVNNSEIDMSWMSIFNAVDARNSMEEGFYIEDVNGAVTFDLLPDGDKIQLSSFAGGDQYFKYENYAGGVQWPTNWEKDNKLFRVLELVSKMVEGYNRKKAEVAYRTLMAGAITSIAHTATGNQIQQDIQTINAGTSAMLQDFIDDIANLNAQQFFLLYNPLQAGYIERVNAAISTIYNGVQSTTNGATLNFGVTPIMTRQVPQDAWYLVMGGHKLVYGNRQDLEYYNEFYPFNLMKSIPGYGRYRFVKGDANQVKRLETS